MQNNSSLRPTKTFRKFAQKVKILKIAVWHNLPSGGGKRALYHHVRGLVERGHTLEAWCPTTADQDYLPLSRMIPEHRLPLDLNRWRGVDRANRLQKIFADYRSARIKIQELQSHARACADEINARDFELLFANPCQFSRVGFISQFTTLPTAIYLQEPNRALYEAAPKLPWIAAEARAASESHSQYARRLAQDWARLQGLRLQARHEYENIRAFNAILVNSFFSRESVKRAYGLDARVCYLGIDTDLFHPTGVQRENYIIGLGGIHPDKQIERAIRAVGALPGHSRPPLLWIGNFAHPPYLDELNRLAKKLGVTFTIKVNISDIEIVDAINRAAVMLYTPRLEPFGFAPLEANACETPVVGIAEGGLRETIQHGVNGLLAETNEPEEIAVALDQVLGDPTYAREMGQRGRELVLERWTWDAAIDRLENALLGLTKRATAAQPAAC